MSKKKSLVLFFLVFIFLLLLKTQVFAAMTVQLGKGLQEGGGSYRPLYVYGNACWDVHATDKELRASGFYDWKGVWPSIIEPTTAFDLSSFNLSSAEYGCREVVVSFMKIDGIKCGSGSVTGDAKWYRAGDNQLVFPATLPSAFTWSDPCPDKPSGWTWGIWNRTWIGNLGLPLGEIEIKENGSYYVKWTLSGGVSDSATAYFTVTGAKPYPADTWTTWWADNPGVNGFAGWNWFDRGPEEIGGPTEIFSHNWGAGKLAYSKSDNIGFLATKSLSFPAGSYKFTLNSDNGTKLFIDDSLEIDIWSVGGSSDAVVNFPTAGSHDFQLEYYEGAGSGNISLSYTVAPIDLTPPTVGTIFTPAQAVKDVDMTYSVFTSDNIGVTYCVFNVDGLAQGNMSVPSPCGSSGCTATMNYKFTSASNYQVKAICGDAAGNETAGAPITINIAAPDEPPTVTAWRWMGYSENVLSNTILTNQYAQIRVRGVDDKGVYSLSLSGPNIGSSDEKAWCFGVPKECNKDWQLYFPNKGPYQYIAKAIDQYGHFAETSIDITVNAPADTTPPVTSVVSVAGDASPPYWDAINDGQTYIIVSGEAGMSCRWGTSDAVYSSIAANECFISGSNAICSLGSPSQSNYWRFVSCKDAIGNEQNIYYENLDILFGVDSTGPTVGTVSPTAAAVNTPTGFSASISDDNSGVDSCWFYTANVPGGSVTYQDIMDTSISGTAKISHIFTSPGKYSAFVLCQDGAGNYTSGPSIDVGASPLTCPAPANFWSTGQTVDSIAMAWDPVSGAKNYKLEWWKAGSFGIGVNSATAPDYAVSYTVSGLEPGNWYEFDVRAESDDQTACQSPGKWYFNDIKSFKIAPLVRTNGFCLKTTTPAPEPISVTLTDGQTCTIKIEPLGHDLTDNSAVSYETLDSWDNSRKIGMDDNPDPGCQNDLKFTNNWSAVAGFLSLTSTYNEKNGWHDLDYGYRLTAGKNCKFSAFTEQICQVQPVGGPLKPCNSPNIINQKMVELVQPRQGPSQSFPWSFLVDKTKYQYAIVPDNPPNLTIPTLEDKWRNAPPSLNLTFTDDVSLDSAFYKIDGDPAEETDWNTVFSPTDNPGINYPINLQNIAGLWNKIPEGQHYIYFKSKDTGVGVFNPGRAEGKSLTIKKDVTAPETDIKVKKETTGEDVVATAGWLNAGAPTIQFDDSDSLSGLKSCQYHIESCDISGQICSPIPDSPVKNRSCEISGPINVPMPYIGLDAPYPYNQDGGDRYRIYSRVEDNAGNIKEFYQNIKTDFRPPTAE